MSNEKTFWKLFKKHVPQGCHVQRIETGSTGLGIPDVNLCLEGQEIWVELKIVKGKSIHLSPEQVAWHHVRNRSGGVTWIIARDKFEGPRKGKGDNIYVWEGRMAAEVLEEGINREPVYLYSAPFDWDEIFSGLFL